MGRLTRFIDNVYHRGVAQLLLLLTSHPQVYLRYGSFLKDIHFDYLSPTGRGLSSALELRRLESRGLMHGQDLLVVGAGKGKEVQEWLNFAPRKLVAIDQDGYLREWKIIQSSWAQRGSRRSMEATPRFLQADAHHLPFQNESFDLITSHNVLEHVMNLQEHISESYRLLRPGGYMYGFIGPLWSTYGGCHVGSLEYKHLEVDAQTLKELVRTVSDGEPIWVERDLLNKLKFDEYLACFKQYFSIEYLALTLSTRGLTYRRKNRRHWNTLRELYSEQDLLIHTMHILLKKEA